MQLTEVFEMAVPDDLPFISAFLTKYGNSDADILKQIDPLQGLSDGLNGLSSAVAGRGDMAGDVQDLILSLLKLG